MEIRDKVVYGQRFRQARDELNLSRVNLAKNIGTHPSTIKNWENGDTVPNDFYQALIEERTEISADWLYTGIEPMILDKGNSIKLRDMVEQYRDNNNPDLRIWGIIGAGVSFDIRMQETEPDKLKPMETIKVSGLLDRKVKDCFRVKGDSMYRLIPHNALVGVDFKDKKIVSGELYALDLPADGLSVKEIHPEGKRLRVHSYNERIKDYYLEQGEWEEYVIAGRIVWIHQDTNKM